MNRNQILLGWNLLDTHYQRTDLGYSFIADFHYRFIREALIFATFLPAGMGVGLYAEWRIRYHSACLIHSHSLPTNSHISHVQQLYFSH